MLRSGTVRKGSASANQSVFRQVRVSSDKSERPPIQTPPSSYVVFWLRGFGTSNHLAASFSQSVKINNPQENPEQWPPCFPHKHRNGAKDWLIPSKADKFHNGFTFIDDERYHLQSDEAISIRSLECWSQTQIIVHFTSQHSTT